jgi:hypothetical protein
MLRISLLSLAIGTGLAFAIVIAGPGLLSSAEAPTDLPVLEWSAEEIEANKDKSSIEQGLLRVNFQQPFANLLSLPHEGANTESYPYLHLELEEYPADLEVSVLWGKSRGKYPAFAHTVTSEVRPSQWLAVRELENWRGDIGNLIIRLASKTGESVTVRKISLHPASVKTNILTLWSDWTSFSPWRRASMNSNLGVTKLSPLYPAMAIACIFLLSLAAYAVLHLAWQRKEKLNWGAIGLVFLFCWLSLDMLWQYKLLRQNNVTFTLFAGKTSEEKLLAGPDAELFSLLNEARQHISEDSARIFVTTSDDYTGLRAAYYLYPHNVYFMLRGRELPFSTYTDNGDYVLVVNPSRVKVNHQTGMLAFKRDYFPAEMLLNTHQGKLVRLTK